MGITLEGKRTQDFVVRVNPFVTLNRGMINFLPPMSRNNTYRLTARYNPATQELGEKAVQLDVQYNHKRKWWAGFNFSNSGCIARVELPLPAATAARERATPRAARSGYS